MHTAIKAQIIALARETPSVEICGFIYRCWTGEPKVLECKNVAEKPSEEFEISIDDQLKVEGLGQPLAVYHSHPASSSGFSPADIESAEEIALPFYLYDVQSGDWHEFVPESYSPSAIGRSWCLGFQDCYGVVRDHFRQEHGIYMADYERDESFSHENQGVISSSYEREGFVIAPISEVQCDDILIFKSDKVLPQHFGVYRGKNRFLHHLRNGLSCEQQLDAHWLSRLICAYRHKSLMKSARNPCNSQG
jgi:proteasome lid subunit RPN8/RPN11